MSIANRDEAVRCREMGREAIKAGNKEKAKRLLEKSLRMHVDPVTEKLLGSLSEKREKDGDKKGGEWGRRRWGEKGASERTTREFPAHDSCGVPPEVSRAISRVLKSKDFYKILEVERGAKEEEIRKQYRKLALKFHPDKCKAPQGEEAFKKVFR